MSRLIRAVFKLAALPVATMSYCKDFGKDKVIFVTKEDHEKPSTVSLPEGEKVYGVVLPNGEINWSCPCLGGAPYGPCAFEFRGAFSCFHHSKAEPKGSECLDKFHAMSQCMAQYPALYPKEEDEEDKKFTEWDNERIDEELKKIEEERKLKKESDATKSTEQV